MFRCKMRIVCYDIYHKIWEEIVVVLECDRHAKENGQTSFLVRKKDQKSHSTLKK